MRNDHEQVVVCAPCLIPGKAPVTFPSEEQYDDHLKTAHANDIDEEMRSLLMTDCRLPIPKNISQCPLCDLTGPADSAFIMDHIAEHLHGFSMRSLPWPKDELRDGREDVGDYFDQNDYFDCSDDHSHGNNACDEPGRDDEDWDDFGLEQQDPSISPVTGSMQSVDGEGTEAIRDDQVPEGTEAVRTMEKTREILCCEGRGIE